MASYVCIWCCRATDKPSLEHLLQCALGCRAARRDIVCGPCNNSFSDKKSGAIDNVLAEQFALVRNALVIWSGRNDPPPTLRDAGKTADGVPFDLAPGLVPIIRRTTRRETVVDGKKVIQVITPVDKAKAAEQAEHLRRQYGDRVHAEKIAAQSVPVPPVQLKSALGGRPAFRAVGKSLLNFAGVVLPRDVVVSDAFAELRNAIRYDAEPLRVGHDAMNTFPAHPTLGQFDHVLQIVSDPTSRTVRGYATLFGRFRFSGLLARDVALDPLTATLVQDPLSRLQKSERRDVVEVADFTPRELSNLKDDLAVTSKLMKEAFTRVMDTATAAAPGKLAAEFAEELNERLAACTTDEGRANAVALFSTKVASAVTRIPFEESLEPSDFGF
jgi:hypothetical protein